MLLKLFFIQSMKRFLLLLLSFHRSWIVAFDMSECEAMEPKDYWLCSREGGTLQVTYDCSETKNKTFELQLWSVNFPKDMRSLKIQNCEKLLLDLNCTSDAEPIKGFQHMHVINVTELAVVGRGYERAMPQPEKDFRNSGRAWLKTGKSDEFFARIYHSPDEVRTRIAMDYPKFIEHHGEELTTVRLPSNVIFENIGIAAFETPLISEWLGPCGFENNEFALESFKLINVTMDQLESHFLWEKREDSGRMKEFVMDKVTIRDVQDRAIYVHNEKAFLEITNSNFTKIHGNFLNFDVSKVTISQNSFRTLPTNTFRSIADKFIFSKNEVATVTGFSFSIQSPEIEITNNIFHHIDDNALLSIMAPSILPNLNSNPLQRILNLSENIIHVLAPTALDLDFVQTDEKAFFDTIAVANNLITCSCANIFWFNSMRSENYGVQKRLFYYLWFNQKNQNRCSNLRNCYLNQVLYNFYELCVDNYKCSDVAMNKTFYGELKPAKTSSDQINDSYFKMFDVLAGQNERVKGVFEDLMNLLSEERKLTSHQNELGLNSYLKSIFSCLFVMTFLFCLVLSYVVVIKCFKFPFFRTLSMRYRSKNPYSETELNSSRMSLTA